MSKEFKKFQMKYLGGGYRTQPQDSKDSQECAKANLILDLGCNRGVMGHFFDNIVGVDINPELCKEAKENMRGVVVAMAETCGFYCLKPQI